MLSPNEALSILKETGVVREGHFLLTTGRHSAQFWLCAQVLQYPQHTAALCQAMAEPFRDAGVQTVVGPAVGGILLAYEVARALGARAIFAEKGEGGAMALRRGFSLARGERVLMVEDAVTTGGSVRQALAAIQPHEPEVLGVSVIVDRSGGSVDFGVPLRALIRTSIPSWAPADCPLCAAGAPLVEPKS